MAKILSAILVISLMGGVVYFSTTSQVENKLESGSPISSFVSSSGTRSNNIKITSPDSIAFLSTTTVSWIGSDRRQNKNHYIYLINKANSSTSNRIFLGIVSSGVNKLDFNLDTSSPVLFQNPSDLFIAIYNNDLNNKNRGFLPVLLAEKSVKLSNGTVSQSNNFLGFLMPFNVNVSYYIDIPKTNSYYADEGNLPQVKINCPTGVEFSTSPDLRVNLCGKYFSPNKISYTNKPEFYSYNLDLKFTNKNKTSKAVSAETVIESSSGAVTLKNEDVTIPPTNSTLDSLEGFK